MRASSSRAPDRGFHENFTVRKISYGEGVERVFPVYSPMVEAVEIVRRGKVRRAKLYYLRDRRGKSARISENTGVRARKLNDLERDALAAEKAKVEAEKVAAAQALCRWKRPPRRPPSRQVGGAAPPSEKARLPRLSGVRADASPDLAPGRLVPHIPG